MDDAQGIHENAVAGGESESEAEHEEIGGNVSKSKSQVSWLCKKLSYLARLEGTKNKSPVVRTSVFQWFAAMATYIPQEKLDIYLIPMISVLYRTINDDTSKGRFVEELKNLAQEVMDILQKQAGGHNYLESYNQIHTKVAEIRLERRNKKAILAVADPRAAAQRKLQRSEMKKKGKKRKNEEYASQKIKLGISKKARYDDDE